MTVAVAAFTDKQDVKYCIDLQTRDRQVQAACAMVPGRVRPVADHDGSIAVVAYGPSLEETYEQVAGFSSILTCSGAHTFLIERGIIPTWHCAVDPLPHTATLIGRPHPNVEYLMASCCHPSVFTMLAGYSVKLFHIFSHEAARKGIPTPIPRDEWAITGGTNVGMRAILLARFLGFRKITVFGMDFSFKQDGTQHAGWHPDERKKIHAVQVGDEVFYTNPAMHSYATEFFKEITKIGKIDLAVVGHGLLQAQIREHCKTKPLIPDREELQMIAATSPPTISHEYLALNQQLHQTNPEYGISGSKRTETVLKLIEATKPESILDYGCGKSTLAHSLPMPIWEYDPAIPGKEALPRPADLVICTDVLEHVEPDYLQAVLLDLARCTKKVCYAVVYLKESLKFLADGRNAHLIQQGRAWWEQTIAQHFTIAKSDVNVHELHLVLGPKSTKAQKPASVPSPDISQRVTPVRYDGTEAKFYTPNEQTLWRAETLFTKEPCTIAWIDTMQAGDVLYDVGANVGGYSIWASRRRGVSVYAFEPEANNYAVLCRNMRLNKVTGFAYPFAVSKRTAFSVLYCSAEMPGGSCHTFGQPLGPDMKPRDGIPQGAFGMTLGDIAHSLPAPTHLKIDVDGLEPEVIDGAERLLKDGTIRSLLIEVNTNLPSHLEMVERLTSYGYRYDHAQVAQAKRTAGPFMGVAEYVFTKLVPMEDAVLNKIAEAPMIAEPFPHLEIEGFFNDDDFAALIQTLPTEGWQSLEEARGTKGYPQRSIHAAPACLSWMTQGRLRAALDAKFGTTSTKDEACLMRDATGYTIPPHTDTPSKAVTMLVSLSDHRHGTSLYTPLIDGYADPVGKHHEAKGFTEAARTSGTANSAFIFARTHTSFHGTVPYEGTMPRDLLLYDTRKATP